MTMAGERVCNWNVNVHVALFKLTKISTICTAAACSSSSDFGVVDPAQVKVALAAVTCELIDVLVLSDGVEDGSHLGVGVSTPHDLDTGTGYSESSEDC